MKLHRDLEVSQPTAWYLAQRIRKGFPSSDYAAMAGPVEVDETFVGGLEKNKPAHKKLRAGRGTVGKIAVAAAKDRETGRISATVVPSTDKATLQPFVIERTEPGATVYTDDHSAYHGLPGVKHQTVRHSVGEYVDGQAHTNGVESFWSHAQEGLPRDVPSRLREAPTALRGRVLGQAQRTLSRHARPDGDRCARHGR